MTLLALTLVLAAAVLHAVWNLFAKQAGGGALFVWLADTLSVLLYSPVAAIAVATSRPLGWMQIAFMGGSATMHLAYFLLLLRGYRAGDMSLVYPLARGTGPVLAVITAVLLLGERPSGLALAGAALIAVGVVILTASPSILSVPGARLAAFYGLATGATIAAYTLWDKQGVSAPFLVPPVLLYYGSTLGRVILLGPLVWRRRAGLVQEWAQQRRGILGVALLSPLSYILVLTALAFTPVSYVAPAREISILIGAGLGTRMLAEGETRRRLLAAGVMVVGVVGLALG